MATSTFSELVDIYPVTGRELFLGRLNDEQVIAALAQGGAKIVQLREKNLNSRELFELAQLYRRETRRHGMLLIINDRPDIAMMSGADGVHLGRGDLPIPQVRKMLGDKAIIGGSSHSVEQALQAQEEGASYVNIGPVFATATKPGVSGIGLGPLKETVARLNIPVTCMGGVNEGNISQILGAGAKHIGVVNAIFGQGDIEGAANRLSTTIRNG